MTDAPSTPAENTPPQGPQLRVLAQYVKDQSFENPSSPESLRGGQAAPGIDIGIDVQARALPENAYEVVLNFSAKASRDGDAVVFMAELSYAGLFQLTGLPDNEREPFLLIECPRLIFPFARRIMSDMTRDGGFPPLMLDPVDFASLYRAQLAKRQAAAQPETATNSTDPAENN